MRALGPPRGNFELGPCTLGPRLNQTPSRVTVYAARTMADEPSAEIIVPPDMQTGVYANLGVVSSQTPHDVTLDFCQVVPGEPNRPPQAIVVARLKLAPSFLMPLMQTLSQHLESFEQQLRSQDEEDSP